MTQANYRVRLVDWRGGDGSGAYLGDYARTACVVGDVDTLTHSTREAAERAARAMERCQDRDGLAPVCAVEQADG